MNNKTILTRIANKMGIEFEYVDDLVIVLEFYNNGIEFHTVDAIVHNDLAVHITYGKNGFCPGYYTITHIYSGMSMEKNKTYKGIVSLDKEYFDKLNEKTNDLWDKFGKDLKVKIFG